LKPVGSYSEYDSQTPKKGGTQGGTEHTPQEKKKEEKAAQSAGHCVVPDGEFMAEIEKHQYAPHLAQKWYKASGCGVYDSQGHPLTDWRTALKGYVKQCGIPDPAVLQEATQQIGIERGSSEYKRLRRYYEAMEARFGNQWRDELGDPIPDKATHLSHIGCNLDSIGHAI